MKKSDLYRERARVLDMCEGTNVDPDKCVKVDGTPILTTPSFDARGDRYSFAVAIVEDKPVFVGDELYWKGIGSRFDWNKGLFENSSFYQKSLSWQPPKKTFSINGEELPCPDRELGDNYSANLEIDGGHGHRVGVKFRSKCDRDKVADALIKLLKDATK